MAIFKMDDGTIVDTSEASQCWDENTRWNGNNLISVNTGSQWDHETLYRSRKGRYYIVHSSQWQGSLDTAEWASNEEAARWLLVNGEKDNMPAELEECVEQLVE